MENKKKRTGRKPILPKTGNNKYDSYKLRAYQKGRPFEPTLEEFEEIISQSCYYCGLDGFGIDRIDSSLGYIKGNMVSCCTNCNMMKWRNSSEVFLNHVKTIYLFQQTKNERGR